MKIVETLASKYGFDKDEAMVLFTKEKKEKKVKVMDLFEEMAREEGGVVEGVVVVEKKTKKAEKEEKKLEKEAKKAAKEAEKLAKKEAKEAKKLEKEAKKGEKKPRTEKQLEAFEKMKAKRQ
jgi:hypothetical protein